VISLATSAVLWPALSKHQASSHECLLNGTKRVLLDHWLGENHLSRLLPSSLLDFLCNYLCRYHLLELSQLRFVGAVSDFTKSLPSWHGIAEAIGAN